jgi:hypothetical protein
MKTEWQFFFKTKEFVFEKEYRFQGSMSNITDIDGEKSLADFSLYIHIVPNKKPSKTLNTHRGKVYITLPFGLKEGKELIETVAYEFAQRISFEYGKFEIIFGSLFGKRIPETEEEEIEVGDSPWFFEMNVVEAVGSPKFNPNKLAALPSSMDSGLIATFNSAKNSDNEVNQFLGFFKIIEKKFPPKNKQQSIKECLLGNMDLFNIYTKVFSHNSIEEAKEEYISYITAIVKARHGCAHLKAEKNFGYIPNDPRIESEVRPYLQSIELITYYAISEKNIVK